VGFGADGVVDAVQAVKAVQHARTKPRAAVAIDYLHVNDQHGIESILGDEFGWDPPYLKGRHQFTVTFHEQFPRDSVQLVSGVLHGKASKGDPFVRVRLQALAPPAPPAGQPRSRVTTLLVAPKDNQRLLDLLNAAKTPRFLSLQFRALVPVLEEIYDFAAGGRWDFEIDAEMEGFMSPFRWRLIPKVEFPDFKLRKRYFPDVYEKKK
jgi:hypothetical protein